MPYDQTKLSHSDVYFLSQRVHNPRYSKTYLKERPSRSRYLYKLHECNSKIAKLSQSKQKWYRPNIYISKWSRGPNYAEFNIREECKRLWIASNRIRIHGTVKDFYQQILNCNVNKKEKILSGLRTQDRLESRINTYSKAELSRYSCHTPFISATVYYLLYK